MLSVFNCAPLRADPWFFAERNVLEVETPVLSRGANTANI